MFGIPELTFFIEISLILFFFTMFAFLFKLGLDIHNGDRISLLFLFAGIMLISILVGTTLMCSSLRDSKIEEVQQEFTGYLDGKEIDLKNVNILQYDATYDYVEKKVFLTEDKDDSNFIFVPIIR